MGSYNASRESGFYANGGYIPNASNSPGVNGLKKILSLFAEIEAAKKELKEKEASLSAALANLDPETKEMINNLVDQINNPQFGGKKI